MPDKNSNIFLSYQNGKSEVLTPAQYEQRKNDIFKKNPSATASYVSRYTPDDDDIADTDRFVVSVGGEPQEIDAATFRKAKDQLYSSGLKGLSVVKMRPVEYFAEQGDDQKAVVSDRVKAIDEAEEKIRKEAKDAFLEYKGSRRSIGARLADIAASGASGDSIFGYTDPTAYTGWLNTEGKAQYGDNLKNYQAARQLLKDAQKLQNSMTKDEAHSVKGLNRFGKFLKGQGQGQVNYVNDLETWNQIVAAEDAASMLNLQKKITDIVSGLPDDASGDAVEKAIRKGLNESELALFDAVQTSGAVSSALSPKMAGSVKAGEIFAASERMGLEFLLFNGIAGAPGRALKRKVTNYLEKRLVGDGLSKTQRAVRSSIAKYAGSEVGAALSGAIQTAMGPSNYSLISKDMQSAMQAYLASPAAFMTPETRIKYGIRGPQQAGELVLNGLVNQLVENATEYGLGPANKVLGALGKAGYRGLTRLGWKNLATLLSPQAAAVLNKAGVGNVFEETGEEINGAIIDYFRGNKDALKDFASWDNLGPMLAGFVPNIGLGAGVSAVQRAKYINRYKDAYDAYYGYLTDKENGKGMTPEDAKVVVDSVKGETPDELGHKAALLLGALDRSGRADKGTEAELLLNLVTAARDYNAVNGMQQIALDEERSAAKDKILDHTNGYQFWQTRPAQMVDEAGDTYTGEEEYVDYLSTNGDNKFFIRKETPSGALDTIDENGVVRTLTAQEVKAGLADGTLTGRQSMSMDEFLDQQNGRRKDAQWEVSAERTSVLGAYRNGLQSGAELSQDDAYGVAQAVSQAEEEALSLGADEAILSMEPEEIARIAFDERQEGNDELSAALTDYATAKSAERGLAEGFMGTRLQQSEAQADELISQVGVNGQVVTAQLPGTDGVSEPVYVLSSDLVFARDGSVSVIGGTPDSKVLVRDVQTGEEKLVSVSDLNDWAVASTEDFKQGWMDYATEQFKAEYEQAASTIGPEGKMAALSGLIGHTILIQDGNGNVSSVKILNMDTENGQFTIRDASGKGATNTVSYDALYDMAQKDGNGDISLDPTAPDNQVKEEAPTQAAPASAPQPAAQPAGEAQDLTDLIGTQVPITLPDGSAVDAFVSAVGDGAVEYEYQDAEGNTIPGTASIDEFTAMMQGTQPAEAPQAQEGQPEAPVQQGSPAEEAQSALPRTKDGEVDWDNMFNVDAETFAARLPELVPLMQETFGPEASAYAQSWYTSSKKALDKTKEKTGNPKKDAENAKKRQIAQMYVDNYGALILAMSPKQTTTQEAAPQAPAAGVEDEVSAATNGKYHIGDEVIFKDGENELHGIITGLDADRKGNVVLSDGAGEEITIKISAIKPSPEKTINVPDISNDTPEAAQARGYIMQNGQRIDRPAEDAIVAEGAPTDISFTKTEVVPGKFGLIEAKRIVPSHIADQENPLHFFAKNWQPKDRKRTDSAVAIQQMANGIRPELITRGASAYEGAPIVNNRGEVIQGNGRGEALRRAYVQQTAENYKTWLAEHAGEFGLTREQVEAMQQPILVRTLAVDDARAEELGKREQKDLESGGDQTFSGKVLAKKLGDRLDEFLGILLGGDLGDDASFTDYVEQNGALALNWLHRNGYINDTEFQNALESTRSGEQKFTEATVSAFRQLSLEPLFANGAEKVRQGYEKLSNIAKLALQRSVAKLSSLDGVIEDVQAALSYLYDYESADPAFQKAKTAEDAWKAIQEWSQNLRMDSGKSEGELHPSIVGNHFAAILKGAKKVKSITDLFDAIASAMTGEAGLFESGEATDRIGAYTQSGVISEEEANTLRNGTEDNNGAGAPASGEQTGPAESGDSGVEGGSGEVRAEGEGDNGEEPGGAAPPESGESGEGAGNLATLDEALAQLEEAMKVPKGTYLYHDATRDIAAIVFARRAVNEMDRTGGELATDERVNQERRPRYVEVVRNYIDKLAEQYGQDVERAGGPEKIVKDLSARLDELNLSAQNGQLTPDDFEAAVEEALMPICKALYKMRYDNEHTNEGNKAYQQTIETLMRGANDDVVARLSDIENLPETARKVLRNLNAERSRRRDVEKYRQQFFDEKLDIIPFTPFADIKKGKFDIWNFTNKDKKANLAPAYDGVLRDKGYKIATQGQVFLVLKESYPTSEEGKTFLKDGKEIRTHDTVRNNWRQLIEQAKEPSGIDWKHLTTFVQGVKQVFYGKEFKDQYIAVKIGDNTYFFGAPAMDAFLQAAREFEAKDVKMAVLSDGKVVNLKVEGSKGASLVIGTTSMANADAPTVNYYPSLEEVKAIKAKREQDRVVAEATSLVTGKPVEEILEEEPAETGTPAGKEDSVEKPQTDAKIEDFGEKIGGARKDTYRAKIRDAVKLTAKDLSTLKDPDKILPRKKIISLMEEGAMSKEDGLTLLSLNMAARSLSGMLGMKTLGLMKYRDLASAWEAGKELKMEITDADIDFLIEQKSDRVKALPNIREKERTSLEVLLQRVYNDYRATYEALNYPTVNRALKSAYIHYGSADGRYWVVGNPSARRGWPFPTMEQAVAKMEAEYPEIKKTEASSASSEKGSEDKIGDLLVVKDDLGYYRVKSRSIPGKIYLSKKFYYRKDAEQFLKDNAASLVDREQKMVDALLGSNIGMVQREGRDYRNGKDVTPDQMLETFGFRGVEFGNWVPQAERQEYLNKTYDAIMDFCDIVGVSPKAFSLGGRLGLAFGARGHSRALAHYEPMKEVINLTRMKGAGSLAHEWFHALDNYLAKQKTGNTSDMATDTKNVVREEMAQAFRDFVGAMNQLDYSKRSRRAGDYWGEVWERAARLFESYVYNELASKSVVSPLLVRKDTLFDDVQSEDNSASSWPYPSIAENEQMKPFFDKLFDTIEEKVGEDGNVLLFRDGEDPTAARERGREFTPEERRISDAERKATNATLDRMSVELGIKINRVSRSEMPKGHQTAKGYFNTDTDEMAICMDNITDERDAIATVLHESVGHYGLRRLFGNEFRPMMRDIYSSLGSKGRAWIHSYMRRHDLQPGDEGIIIGMEEYLSHLAERTNEEPTIWQKIQNIISGIIDKVFHVSGFRLTDNELNYILRASYEHLKDPNWLNTAKGKAFDALLKRQLGINETDPNKPTDPEGPKAGYRFREGDETPANIALDRAMQKKWNHVVMENQNSDLPVKIGMEEAMREVGKESLREDEDFLTRHNLAGSRAETEAHDFELFYFKPLLEQVRAIQSKLVGDKSDADTREEAYQRALDYLYAVSGLERNRYKNNEIDELREQALAALRAQADAKKEDIRKRLKDPVAADLAIEKVDSRLAEKEKEISEKFEAKKRDWSGLTSLMGESDWRKAEAKAQEMVDAFKAEVGDAAALDELWDRIRRCTDHNLEHAYKHGLLTREEYERLHGTPSQPRMWNYYLPLRGFAEGTAEEEYSYYNILNPQTNSAVVKEMKGRWTEADNPLANILNIAEMEIVQGNQNWAKQALYRFVLGLGKNSLFSEREPWFERDSEEDPWRLAVPDEHETYEEFEKKMQRKHENKQEDGTPGKPMAKKGRQNLKLEKIIANPRHENEHLIRLKVGGMEKMIWVNGNNAVVKAVNDMGRAQNWKTIRRASRALSNLFTTYSLDFTARNFFRDTIYSRLALIAKEDNAYRHQYKKNWWKNLGYGAFAFPMIKLMAGWESGRLQRKANPTKKEQMFMDFMHDGGQTGYTIVNSVDKIKRDLQRSMRNAGKDVNSVRVPLLGHLAEGIRVLNEAFELLTRFTAYETSRDMGRSGQRSALDAKEISVNFNRKGTQSGEGLWGNIAAYLGGTHYFYNAGVQGFDNFLRLFKTSPVKMTVATGGLAALGVVVPLINSMLAGLAAGMGDGDGDDDWYWELPEWVRRNNLIIGCDKFYLAVPLSVELRAFYGLGDIAASLMYGKTAARNGFEVGLDAINQIGTLLPINPVEGFSANGNTNVWEGLLRTAAPDAGMFIIDLSTNRDFTGRPLSKENPFSGEKPAAYGAFASTPKALVDACQWLAKVSYGRLDIAPGKVRNVFRNLGGGFYRLAEDVSKLAYADIERPRRWDDIPFFSGFTGHIDEDRKNSFATTALYNYKENAEGVVHDINAVAGTNSITAKTVYEEPEKLPDNARVQVLLSGERYILGKMYHDGMKNEYVMKRRKRTTKYGKAGEWYKSKEVKRYGVESLKEQWKAALKTYVEIPDKEKERKAEAYLEVEDAWHRYTDAQGNLVDRLMEEEYNHVQEKRKNGIPYTPKETWSQKVFDFAKDLVE